MTATLENVAKKKDKRSRRVSSRRPRSWSAGPGAGPVPDRPGRPARAADQGDPGNGRDQELTEHLGHEKNAPAGNEPGNNRNGTRPKAGADREHGDVRLEVPRRRDGNFKIAGTPGVVVARVVKTPGTGIANRDTLRQRDWESGGEPGLGRRAERR